MISHQRKFIHVATWMMRAVVGIVFAFSGFTKAIDPWGTIYKFDDYLAAMSLTVWPNLVLVAAFLLSGIEFICGVFLLTGCFRKSVTILVALIMAVMLPLSIWIAMVDPVADCGCFGDAYIISNWATFGKNVVLSACVVWLLLYNKRCHWLITPALQWLALVVSAVFIVAIELCGYAMQPLIDFRPYAVGSTLIDTTQEEGPEYSFIYEKNGIRKEFRIDDDLPSEESGWVFVERTELPNTGSEEERTGHANNLRIWSKDGDDDVTEEAIAPVGKELIVMMPDLSLVSPATTWKLNSLYEWSQKNDVTMIAVVSGSSDEIAQWEDLSMASYPIFTADDTQIKSVVRGNPGVVYLIDGVIQWKSTLSAINTDDFQSSDTSHDAANFGLDDRNVLRSLAYTYLSVMAVLVILSFLPYTRRMYEVGKKLKRSGAQSIHDDMAHGEE